MEHEQTPEEKTPIMDENKEMTLTEKKNNISEEKFIGLTKWFNEKSGFGFISYPYGVNGIENGTKDIFVHYSNINPVNKESYKALHMGEYVEFQISNIEEMCEDKEIRTQAVNVTGVGGGMLMNEYRLFASKMQGEGFKKNNSTPFSHTSTGFSGKGGGGGRGKGKGSFSGKGMKTPFQKSGNGKGNFPFSSFSGKVESKQSQEEEWTPTK